MVCSRSRYCVCICGRSSSHITGISILTARISSLIHPKPFQVNQIVLRRMILQLGRSSARFALTCSDWNSQFRGISRAPLHPCPFFAPRLRCTRRASAGWDRQRTDPPEHASEKVSGQIALRQEKPIVPRVLDQSATGFHESLLQAGKRPVVDLHAQPQPHLVRPKAVAAQPCHPHRLLAFFDPLLRRAAFVVEPHYRPAVGLQVGDDESHPRKQFAKVELHLGHHAGRYLPTRRPIRSDIR